MKAIRRKSPVIAAEMERCEKWRPRCRKRRYSTLGAAIALTAKWMVTDGYVGDKIVLYDIESGLEIGTLTLSATGRINAQWVWWG